MSKLFFKTAQLLIYLIYGSAGIFLARWLLDSGIIGWSWEYSWLVLSIAGFIIVPGLLLTTPESDFTRLGGVVHDISIMLISQLTFVVLLPAYICYWAGWCFAQGQRKAWDSEVTSVRPQPPHNY